MPCKCPRLTPLQSRLAASVLALALVAVVLWTLSNPHFAYAAELDEDGAGGSRSSEDHNWHRIGEERLLADGVEGIGEGFGAEEVDGEDFDGLEARQSSNELELVAIAGNNKPNNLNIETGQTATWVFREADLHGPFGDVAGEEDMLPEFFFDPKPVEEEAHAELKRRSVEEDGSEGSTEKRQSAETRTVYISMNTCLQPSYNGTDTQTDIPPRLTLYVATSSSNDSPGPGSSGEQTSVVLEDGFANISIIANDDVYMAVHAPELGASFTGGWNYEIAVSIDDYYHRIVHKPFLYLVDTESTAALLVTDNLTDINTSEEDQNKWMKADHPFTIFASNTNYTRTMGLTRSFCGLRANTQIQPRASDSGSGLTHLQMTMTERGLGNLPKQQFYVPSLNASSGYSGILAMDGNSSSSGAGVVGGGGTVWEPVQWITKAESNCALMFDLEFCSEVAYAVPANTVTFPNRDNLAARYDAYASELYQNFTYSLQQIACNASSDSSYSPAKTCADCAHAYKEWLCAVTIPRCEDYSAGYDWLQPRNVAQRFPNGTMLSDDVLNASYIPMSGAPKLDGSPAWSQTMNSTFATNRSRNYELIDLEIMPGPYKEVLPCEDLCYSLMQSCPAAMGIACPSKGKGLEKSYGQRDDAGSVKCSYLGAVFYQNGAAVAGTSLLRAGGVALLAAFALVLL